MRALKASSLSAVLIGLVLLGNPGLTRAQSIGDYHLKLEEITIPGIPALQSFASGEANGKWLLIGGRTDGLHRRQPWASFWNSSNNLSVFVVDPVSLSVWSQSLDSLSPMMKEQLQSTNMQFEQVGDILYITGGYGYSNTAAGHTTFPYLTAVNVPAAMQSIISGNSMAPHFRQVSDSGVKVTGGYLDHLDGFFYLVGGHDFVGLYNPMGPNNGPGFFQAYTNQIRKFQIIDNGSSIAISNYSAITDTMQLHRRDYNLVPQVFPNGTMGFTAFSGVFQYGADLPWLNTVDITANGYSPNSVFNQYLNQYHTANMPLYDSDGKSMHTVFFGGIARYTLDGIGNLVDDQRVPFVKTISLVSRDSTGSMTEVKLGDMPDYLGAGAEFIRNQNTPIYSNEVLRMDMLSADTSFVGYVYGGIQSTLPNIFFINTGVESVASSRVFKVYLVKGAITGLGRQIVDSKAYFRMSLQPNPAHRHISIRFQTLKDEKVSLQIFDKQGRLMDVLIDEMMLRGQHEIDYDVSGLAEGAYTVVLRNREFSASSTFIKRK